MSIKDEIYGSIRKADPKLEETSTQFMDQAVLLASGFLGADENEIAAELGYEREFVGLIGSRLRNAGIWEGDQLNQAHHNRWCAKDGGVSFLLDAAVAGGDMALVDRDDKGEPSYALTPIGIARVEKLGLR